MRFVDTNVLLYAISSDPGERAKAARANAILDAGDVALSVQVLEELPGMAGAGGGLRGGPQRARA